MYIELKTGLDNQWIALLIVIRARLPKAGNGSFIHPE